MCGDGGKVREVCGVDGETTLVILIHTERVSWSFLYCRTGGKYIRETF